MNEIRFQCHAIIPSSASPPQALLLPSASGWSLPSVQLDLPPNSHLWREVAPINQAFKQQFGLQVTTLYCASLTHPQTEATGVFVLENHDPAWSSPPHARCVGHDDLDTLSYARPDHVSLLREWFASTITLSTTKFHLSWEQPGWFDDT